MKLTLGEAARISGGRLVGGTPGTEATRVCIDSRRARPGDLFVALPGDFADGHTFVEAALLAGAAAAMVTRPVVDLAGAPLGPLLVVEDPLAALRALGAWVRDVADPIVVGITGSTGKTSTKDLLASVAGVRFRTVAAERSHNNELGVPLTLLQTSEDTEVLVCELGARGPGQIRDLCTYVRPQIGIVTNVGVTHYELFGSVDAIVAAKSELVASLPEGGVAVLNADDARVAGMAGVTAADVLTYGLAPGAAGAARPWLRGEAVEVDALGRPSFRLVRGYEHREVRLGVSGRHQVSNALAAATAGLALGMSLDEVAAGLERARSSPWRMEVTERGGVVVVNDAYNANPTSVAAALGTCAAMVPPGGRLLAVLGYMAELGDLERPEHERAGALAAQAVQRLVVVGERAAGMAAGAKLAGLEDVVVVPGAAGVDGALEALGELRRGDVVLVKASRVAGLERLAPRLVPSAAVSTQAEPS
jgi:UDP-N-acetylmuramoyl-tripeptide--D-alanyl-D-alanine ligase